MRLCAVPCKLEERSAPEPMVFDLTARADCLGVPENNGCGLRFFMFSFPISAVKSCIDGVSKLIAVGSSLSVSSRVSAELSVSS